MGGKRLNDAFGDTAEPGQTSSLDSGLAWFSSQPADDPIITGSIKELAMIHPRLASLLLALLAAAFSTGCETGFVTDAARTSLASFVIDVVSTAANEEIGP